MPYTPPSQRSPAASTAASPNVSRSNSYVKSIEHPVPGVGGYFPGPRSGPRPGLPRSASSTAYLNRERRSPQAPKQSSQPSPDLTPVTEKGSNNNNNNGFKNPQQSGSLRQSPPPVNNNLIPTGAVISPPDSTQNSSDDEESSRGRSRRLENLEELQAAISAIEQRKEGSPERDGETGKPKLTLEVTSPSPLPTANTLSPPLSREQRKISHSRSNTESNIVEYPRPMESPDRSSDEDLEMARLDKPPMVRKKSGELVRPALRPSSAKRRPSSMPGTPTYNKVVHFDNQLEHVRTFLQVDKPAAVSAGSSPVDPYDSETEFPFDTNSKKEAPFEWEIKTPNFPSNADRRQQPVMVEKIFLSADKKLLIGSVIVKNWSFQKSVVTRFTLDYWKTTSEVAAEFSHDIRKDIEEGHDRFMFNIRLADQTNLENKTLFFCVRYNTDGQEFWDSNNLMNFQVEFSKKNIPQRGKSGMTQSKSMVSLSSLPRSNKQRPIRLPTFDDFADIDAPFNLDSPPTAASLIGEKPIKFRQKSIVPGSFGVQSRAAQAFGNRYDFGASLSATKNGSPTFPDLKPSFAPGTKPEETTTNPEPTQTSAGLSGEISKPAALSEKPSLQSQSYNDLINKYCFFGSAKSSPTTNQRPGNGQSDGANDDNDGSSDGSYGFSYKDGSSGDKRSSPLSTSSPSSNMNGSPLGPRTSTHMGFPFPQSMQGSMFDSQTPTAILS